MGKHYWKEILPKALVMKEQGYTHRMIAKELGYTYEQIKKLMYRYNKSKKKCNSTIPARLGRPRTKPLTTQEECTARIKQLEMENELVKKWRGSFLSHLLHSLRETRIDKPKPIVHEKLQQTYHYRRVDGGEARP